MSSTKASRLVLIDVPRMWYQRYPVAAFLVGLVLTTLPYPR
jgi:hypothetical protein